MNPQTIFTTLATILVFIGYIPYIRDVIRGTTRPHIFSFFIWALTTFIIFFLQLKNGGGVGSWITFVVGCLLILVLLLSLKNGKRDIRNIDIIFFVMALLAIPLWLLAKQPVLSISLLVLIDVIAFVPAMRKTYVDPWSENKFYYMTAVVRHGLTIFALVSMNYITILSPLVGVIMNTVFISILVVRRKILSRNLHQKRP